MPPLERATRCCLQTLVVFGCHYYFFFLRTPDTSCIPTEAREHEARERGNFSAPRLWLQCWVLLPVAARGEGNPLVPGSLGRPHRQPPAGSAGQQLRGSARFHGKERTGQRAHAACNQRVSRRALGASCGAQPARLVARSWRVLRGASGASCGAQAARRAARTRRVIRRANGASCDAHPARFPTRTQRVLRRAVGTLLRRAKYLHSELVCFDSGFVAVISFRLGNVYAQSHSIFGIEEAQPPTYRLCEFFPQH